MSGALPDVTNERVSPPVRVSPKVADTIWNPPSASSPVALACESGTMPTMRAWGSSLWSSFSNPSITSGGNENSTSA
jgi:hypothetical protein